MRKFGQWSTNQVEIPWLSDSEFQAAYRVAAERTIVPIDRCYILWAFAKYAMTIYGHFAECGVYRGGTAALIAQISRSSKDLFLFDTFSGIPPGDASKDNRYIKGGEFGDTSYEAVSEFLNKNGLSAAIFKGMVPETFETFKDVVFSFVHLDMDIYKPTKHALEFFYPRMHPGGVIVLDDYGAEECAGIGEALREYGCPFIPLPTGQALVIANG